MLKRIMVAGFCLILLFLSSCKKNVDFPLHSVVTSHADGDVIQLLKSNIAVPVNIVIVGEGFQNTDLVSGGVFDTQVKTLSDFIFSTAPFNSYKQYFNVYAVCTVSNDKGTGNNAAIDTKFKTYFSGKPNISLKSSDLVTNYTKKAVGDANTGIVILLVNTPDQGFGSTGQINITGCNDNSLSTLLHKIGHTFASLGDEYVDLALFQSSDKKLISTFPNLDVTSDPAKVKWSGYLKLAAYKSVVSVYEGGYYAAKGTFRPEGNSVMFDAANCTSYNAPSREAIARRICTIAGIPFNMDDFLEKDKLAIQPRLVISPATTVPVINYPPGVSF